MDWQDIKSEFEWDGSLRDLYISEADAGTWQQAWDLLRTGPYPLCYTVEGEIAKLPAEITAIFQKRLEANVMLSVEVQGLHINCHFFAEEQIAFDIDPREVNTEARFNQLCAFMQWIGRGLKRNVILTPETSGREEETAIFRYLPDGDQFEYVPTLAYPGR